MEQNKTTVVNQNVSGSVAEKEDDTEEIKMIIAKYFQSERTLFLSGRFKTNTHHTCIYSHQRSIFLALKNSVLH